MSVFFHAKSYRPHKNTSIDLHEFQSFFSRLRKKIKARVNEKASQKIIDDKVREEVVKELMKIKEKFTSAMDINQTSLSPGETNKVSQKRPGTQISRRRVRRINSTQETRRTSVRRRPVRRTRQRPRSRASRRRVSCRRRHRSRSYSRVGRK